MENNKQYILILVSLLLLGGLAYYFVSSGSSSDMSDTSMDTEVMMDDSDKMMDDEDTMMDDSDKMMDDTMMKEAPEGALKYEIDSGDASYTVFKGWLEKPGEDVTGTTSDVGGSGWFNAEDGALYLMATVDTTTLDSGSENRDADVLSMIGSDPIKLELEMDSSTLVVGETFEVTVPAMVTINGVTVEEEFTVTGELLETGFSAQGSTETMMSKYDIEAPSMLNLYNVSDEMTLAFEVAGSAMTE